MLLNKTENTAINVQDSESIMQESMIEIEPLQIIVYGVHTKDLNFYHCRSWLQFMYTIVFALGADPEEQGSLSGKNDECDVEESESKLEPMKTSWNLHWSLTVSHSDDEGDMLEKLVPGNHRSRGLAVVPGQQSEPWTSMSAALSIDCSSTCSVLPSWAEKELGCCFTFVFQIPHKMSHVVHDELEMWIWKT